ncbi:MAG: PadR family transcriptional regulator [Caulobacterales bacterium]|uniref:PadR family transcriptional regulator n=1 Tax=Glycocaulis sp. TaxID=1969725 RepID=UPI003FA0649C
MDIEGWKAQLRKGAAEFAVLSLLARREMYGIELLDALSGADGLGISDGTIYPLLKRLQSEGRISARWQPSVTGPPRKYYRLTAEGQRAVSAMGQAWAEFRLQLDRLAVPDLDQHEPDRDLSE